MIYAIRFLDYFGGTFVAFGLLWFYMLNRRESLTEIMPVGYNQPIVAILVVAVGAVMVGSGRLMAAYIRFQIKRMRAQQ